MSAHPCQRGSGGVPCGVFVGPEKPWGPENCRLCWRFATSPTHHAAWSNGQVLPLTSSRSYPCRHRGDEAGEESCAGCGGNVRVKLFGCTLHGSCSIAKKLPGRACCVECSDYAAKLPTAHWEWISTAQLMQDAIVLAGLLPPEIEGVAGVPRSGLLPAAAIATYRHLPLYAVDASGPHLLQGGSRMPGRPTSQGMLAVVDDTVYTGKNMRKVRQAMDDAPAVYAVVYAKPEAASVCDLYTRLLPSPHVLEWNVLNNGPVRGMAANPCYGRGLICDLDGIILHDAESGGRLGTPYLLPRFGPCPIICTGRREKDRAVTEAELRRWGAQWTRLVMLPDDAGVETTAAFKAAEYGRSGCGLFLESNPAQAAEIHRLTKLPVACPRAGVVFQDTGEQP